MKTFQIYFRKKLYKFSKITIEMKNTISAVLISLTLLSLFALVSPGCKKEGPCEAQITVTDTSGKFVSGALVILRQDEAVSPTTGAQANIRDSAITNSIGQATFEFKLEAVLNIEASKDSLSGKDYIRLEQSKMVARTVIIK